MHRCSISFNNTSLCLRLVIACIDVLLVLITLASEKSYKTKNMHWLDGVFAECEMTRKIQFLVLGLDLIFA